MKAFKFLWHGRIMARIGTDEPIEIARYKDRPVSDADWNQHTRELSPIWEVWRESRTPDTWLVGERPIPTHHGRPDDQTAPKEGAAIVREIVPGGTLLVETVPAP